MRRQELLAMMRTNRFAIQASVSSTGSPQAAVVGIIVTDDLEIFFDTLDTTRKMRNLRQNPKIAFVIGGTVEGDQRTVQYEGIADEPTEPELERLKSIYFDRFPDGRGRLTWPGLVYVRARPSWIRYSDFNVDPPLIIELGRDQVATLL